jgi:hypothetical protein
MLKPIKNTNDSVAGADDPWLSRGFRLSVPGLPLPVESGWKRSTASDVDDSPFDGIDIGFAFPFFGKEQTRLWISPNGGIWFHERPPCCNINLECSYSMSGFGGAECNVDTTYRDLIFALVADWDPSREDTDARILYHQTPTTFTVRYEGVGLFVPSFDRASLAFNPLYKPSTFDVTLYDSGRIQVRAHDVYDITDAFKNDVRNAGRMVMRSGLRAGVPDALQTRSSRSDATQWGFDFTVFDGGEFTNTFTADGVYPVPRENVLSNYLGTMYYPTGPSACYGPIQLISRTTERQVVR